MEDLHSLRMVAERIPLAQSPYLHPAILHRLVLHRQKMLSCDDVGLIKDYISRATYEESLVVLTEIQATAPLSEDYHVVFCHLVCTVYHAAGLEIPVAARLAVGNSGEPTSQMRVLMDNFRRDIRKAQRGTQRCASLQ